MKIFLSTFFWKIDFSGRYWLDFEDANCILYYWGEVNADLLIEVNSGTWSSWNFMELDRNHNSLSGCNLLGLLFLYS